MARRVVIHASAGLLRKTSSFGLSGIIHASLLAWLVISSAIQSALPPAPTLYDLAIRPYEKHLVFYDLRQKLPDVKPAETASDPKAPRARAKFPQNVVSGKQDDARPPQMILMPAPAIELPKPLPLPNMLAVKETTRVRPFVPPPPPPPPAPKASTPSLPEAPRVPAEQKANPLDLAAAAARPVRPFVPPVEHRPDAAPRAELTIPDAPRIDTAKAALTLPVEADVTGPRRRFSLPSAPAADQPAATASAGPAAPELVPDVPLSAAMPRIPRGFTAPPAPAKGTTAGATPSDRAIEAPPPLAATPTPGADATLAIVGLNPSKVMDVPPPKGSHEAGFSAGPRPRPADGASGANSSAELTIPGLSTRGGANQPPVALSINAPGLARQKLLAALHEAAPPTVPRLPASAPAATSGAARVSSAPDPRMRGRYIYMLAIQMPNVTSYSGSWVVWFAEHEPEPGAAPGDMRPPVALRKVDPKYIQAAVDERVEGTVRLSAIIRKSGHVDTVELLQHLDVRLDRSAEEALSKWEFEPAQRNGRPVDIDAVFEIPFRLAPKPKR